MRTNKANSLLIIDFGSQTTHLISRRFKEISINSKIITPQEFNNSPSSNSGFAGYILSGGPESVYKKNSPTISPEIFKFNRPILGICYGQQLITHLLSGKVKPGKKHEFGPAELKITNDKSLFKPTSKNPIPEKFQVWMSHGDEVKTLPTGFKSIASTETIQNAAIANHDKKIFGVQFHPEVVHTQFGDYVLFNFAEICNLSPSPQELSKSTVNDLIKDIRESIGNQKTICALSGGVDSSVAASLVHEAIGKNLISIYIDSGLMRNGETESLKKVFRNQRHMNIKIIKAKSLFLNRLKNIVDPEKKRKIIGKTFIDIFNREAKKIHAKFLVQGTIYPDVIESSGSKHSHNIKSHHNVGGLPKNMKLSLVEPLRTFYKDEVRQIGKYLNLPDTILARQPFPGPGLAVRTIGKITPLKLKILREAEQIIAEETAKSSINKTLWQIFAIHTGIKTTGVKGDARAYGDVIAIRAVEAKDGMTAKFAHLPYDLLEKISVRIVNEIKPVVRILYDITNKPPGTIEWE